MEKIDKIGSTKFKAIPGRPKQEKSKRAAKVIDRRLTVKPSTSVRSLATLAQVSKSTAHKLKRDLGYKSLTKQPASKATSDQEERIKRGALKIYKKLVPSGGEKIIIMDDETYVPQDPSEVPGEEFYSEKPGCPVQDLERFKRKTKFAKKFLVWQAMDQHGNVSDSFISQGTINGKIYLEECLTKRLLPFILRYNNVSDVLFWPDMARTHYATEVVEWLKSQNIDFVGRACCSMH